MPNRPGTLAVAWGLLWCLASNLSAASGVGPRQSTPYVVDVWDTDEGLPQNSVTSILQTRDGYLWLGTLNGLVRFDGTRFTVYDESNTPGLNSSRIVCLFEDRHGALWIGTQTAGVARFRDGQATSLGIGQGGADRRLVAACEDAAGAVWLYTADGQLWRHQDGRFRAFLVGQGRPSACRALIAEPGGALWVGTDGRLSAISRTPDAGVLELPVEQDLPVARLDGLLASQRGGYWRLAEGRVQKWRGNRLERDFGAYAWGSAPIAALAEDRQGNLLVGTLGVGVYWLGPEGRFAWLATAQGLSQDVILSLCVDREGNLWVGADGGGLNRVRRQVFEVLDKSRGLPGNVIQSVCEDAEGGLWIGSNDGGVSYWKDGVARAFGPPQGLANSHVWSVFIDRQQRVWAGTRGGGLFQYQQGRFQPAPGAEGLHRELFALHQDREGALWLGTLGGLGRWDERAWKVFTTRDGLPADEVRAIASDRQGNLWIGTMGGGLGRLRDGQFTCYHKRDGLPSEDISSLYVDGDDILWIGTFGGGLGRLDRGTWTHYTTREGLLSNSIGYLLEDDQADFWMGSNAGILRAPKRELNAFARGVRGLISCRAYGKADGLPTRECTLGSQPGACRARDGKLWFPTVKGLVSVHPAQLQPNPHAPPVMVEMVLIDGQPQSAPPVVGGGLQTLIVPPGKERVEIHYHSLNLTAPDRGRYRYWLEGYETAWTEAGNRRVAPYSKLPPRRYRFQVQACNEDGVWNEAGATLALLVQPPFWKTWWFLGGSTASLLGLIIGVVYYLSTQRLQRQVERLQHQEAVEKERARIARDIHDQLGANLTQIALLSELVESDKDRPDEVETQARQICQTARDTTRVLDEIVWAVNPSNDTLDGLMTYVCKHAQEYLSVAGLRCRLEVPDQLPPGLLPPDVRHNVFLAFKEAVTNVVRHARASGVWVRLRLAADTFTLEIEDNGRGMAGLDDPAAASRNGLRNMRKRLEALGGSFSLGPAPDGGTLVRLTAPRTPPTLRTGRN